MIEAFKSVYDLLTTCGLKPRLNVMDNECSKAIKTFILSTGAAIQLVEPDNHRVNAAERAIQTFKNHFIAGLCTVDPAFPLQLWDELLEQGQDSMNLLRTSRINPKLSAYAVVHGQYNFNKNSFGTPWMQSPHLH